MNPPFDPGLRVFYLKRLARLASLRNVYRDELSDFGIGLLERAIAATVADCALVGAVGQAQEILDRAVQERRA